MCASGEAGHVSCGTWPCHDATGADGRSTADTCSAVRCRRGQSGCRRRALLQLATDADLTVTLRACRYPHRLRAWKPLPSGLFVATKSRAGSGPAKEPPARRQVLKGESPRNGADDCLPGVCG